MSIDKFDEGSCYKETYSMQDFIWKAIARAKDFSLLELLHYFNDITNGIISWRITLLCVFSKLFCALLVSNIKCFTRKDIRTVKVWIEFTDT